MSNIRAPSDQETNYGTTTAKDPNNQGAYHIAPYRNKQCQLDDGGPGLPDAVHHDDAKGPGSEESNRNVGVGYSPDVADPITRLHGVVDEIHKHKLWELVRLCLDWDGD
ncbi:hypothetical protein FE257_001210 [Aspergillus nanangensis]|uniref:Uncharacterized protein n=1 Tax=Aspergillus nanangensis TaxID=2582783 RepID=A0AAD4CE28_ASPNN|nr:hypothetical protein FE257_001210 [Aspergillus nanangensis]